MFIFASFWNPPFHEAESPEGTQPPPVLHRCLSLPSFLRSKLVAVCPSKTSVANGLSLHNPSLQFLRNQGRGHGPLSRLRRQAHIGFEPASCTFGYCSSTAGCWTASCWTLRTTTSTSHWELFSGRFWFSAVQSDYYKNWPKTRLKPTTSGLLTMLLSAWANRSDRYCSFLWHLTLSNVNPQNLIKTRTHNLINSNPCITLLPASCLTHHTTQPSLHCELFFGHFLVSAFQSDDYKSQTMNLRNCWAGLYQPELTDLTNIILFFHISHFRTSTLKI